jgi:hypothetical protein
MAASFVVVNILHRPTQYSSSAFTLDPLQPNFVYLGPTQITANSCRCSTVYYSLLSACAYCQNETYLDWSIYDVNCTVLYSQTFLDPIPSSIVVPHYAYLDVVKGNSFNVSAAMVAGGPESTPVSGPTGPTTPAITSTSTPTSSSAAATSQKLNVGAIAGGAVGGVAFVGIIGALIYFATMRRRRPSVPTPSTYTAFASPMMSDGDMKYNSAVPTMTSGKIYDPSDPSTFPSDPVGYSSYSGSPQRVTPTITGNTLVGAPGIRTHHTGPNTGTQSQYTGAQTQYSGAPTQFNGVQTQYNGAQTQYSGAPEL